jgi:peptidoglycan/xylan/chitin deacetylase (PgdA/CDA1 family)
MKAVEDACGVRPTLLRPPVGHVSSRTAAAARRLGLRLIAWSVRARDGLGERDADRVARRIERGLRDGAIVALHDASEKGDFEPASVAALPRILDALERRGLRSVTIDEIARSPSEADREQPAPVPRGTNPTSGRRCGARHAGGGPGEAPPRLPR